MQQAAARGSLARASWGIEIVNAASGRVLYARDAQKNFKPASTFKLLATAAALDTFGPDHRFRTTLQASGRVDAFGRLLGDLYLVGGGDATLASFERLAEALRAASVRRIEGRVIGWGGAFQGERRGDDWGWEDLTWCYGAEIAALSFADNCVALGVLPGESAGDPVRVDAVPRSRYYSVVSVARTTAAGTEPDLALSRASGSNEIRLSGTMPLGADVETLRIALEDPAHYAAQQLVEALEERGVSVSLGAATSSEPLPAGMRVLASQDGPPLGELLALINKPSQNLYTEVLLRSLGTAPGTDSLEAGHRVVASLLSRAGVDAGQAGLHDGSGLSRTDLVTAADLVALLRFMGKHQHAAVFRASLPVAGVDGTLKGRLRGTPAEGRVFAKTGSLRGVAALAGYARTVKGEERVFAIFCNNFTADDREARAAIDEIVKAIVAK